MRVAHFVQRHPPAMGGSETYFARLGRFFRDRGDQVTVFTSNALALEAFWSRRGQCTQAGVVDEDGIQIRRYPLWRVPGRRYLLKALSFWPSRTWQCLTMPCNPICFDMLRDADSGCEKFDLVHATAFPYAWPIVCGMRLARRLKIPFMLTPFLHLGDPDDPHDRTRRAYTTPALLSLIHAADAVFVQTPSEGAELRRHGVPAEKIVEQGLGVDVAECMGARSASEGVPEVSRSSLASASGSHIPEVVVGHLANNSREKGTVDLLCAVEKLWQRDLPLRVVLAGPEMPNFLRFWRQFERRRPRAAVVRLGVLTEQQKREFFVAIDIFALPSRSDSFGLVLLEAWANGVPNIAYRAGGIADIVRDEQDGLLVPCGDVDALSRAIERLARDAELRRRLGDAGKARLPIEFRWEDKLNIVRQKALELVSARVTV